MVETKRDVPKRKPVRWGVVLAWVTGISGLLGVGLKVYDKLWGATPTPAGERSNSAKPGSKRCSKRCGRTSTKRGHQLGAAARPSGG